MEPASKRERALHEAAAKVAGAARSAFLDGACSDDPALRERVEAFLAGQLQAAAAGPDPGEDLRPTIKLGFTEGLRDEAVGWNRV